MAIYLNGKKTAPVVKIEVSKPTQSKTVNPTTSQQVVGPDEGYGLSGVIVEGVTNEIDSNIKAENIAKDVTILGVTGTFEGGVTPEGTLDISTNGEHDVANYATALVQVPSEQYLTKSYYQDNTYSYYFEKVTNFKKENDETTKYDLFINRVSLSDGTSYKKILPYVGDITAITTSENYLVYACKLQNGCVKITTLNLNDLSLYSDLTLSNCEIYTLACNDVRIGFGGIVGKNVSTKTVTVSATSEKSGLLINQNLNKRAAASDCYAGFLGYTSIDCSYVQLNCFRASTATPHWNAECNYITFIGERLYAACTYSGATLYQASGMGTFMTHKAGQAIIMLYTYTLYTTNGVKAWEPSGLIINGTDYSKFTKITYENGNMYFYGYTRCNPLYIYDKGNEFTFDNPNINDPAFFKYNFGAIDLTTNEITRTYGVDAFTFEE